MKSIDDTTIAEFSSGDNQRVEVERQARALHVYLLRCWWERRATAVRGRVWRFSMEEIFGERRMRGFRDLEALVEFLRAELASGEGAVPENDDGQ
jgi:hypothetical protein